MGSDPARKLYRALVALYPRDFRMRFGESMEQTFDDACSERNSCLPIFLDTAVGVVSERWFELVGLITMTKATPKARNAAILGAVLCIPPTAMISMLVLNIEPPFGEALRGEPDTPNVIGSLIALTVFLLLPTALFINLRPLLFKMRAGEGIISSPMNLAVAATSFGVIAFIVGAIIVDQYPCWMGVPNCD